MKNTLVSHYQILEELGRGGMGVVYRAEDTRLKRTVALKFLAAELCCDADAKERFRREAQAASALQHQNVCAIHDIEETVDGQIFICMDLYSGQTLKERLADGIPLPVAEAMAIAGQVAAGLAKAHEKGIIHRDIKPANIFITEEGTVKLLDFGLAKLASASRLTRLNEVTGTAAYMSPEQAAGVEVDGRTDIWSLGVVLYEMLAGTIPFQGDYEQAIVYQILHQKPPPLPDAVPGELKQLVNDCLAKDPANRIAGAGELARRLRPVAVTPTGNEKKILSGWKITALAAGAIILAAALYFIFRPATAASPAAKTIAVLPFVDLDRSPDNEYFSDGITEDILTQLSKISDLRVISRTTMMKFKNSQKTISEIGALLKAGVILEGSVRRVKNNVRIVAQLIDARRDTHLWAETYDRDLTNIFVIQSDVAAKIAAALKARLSPDDEQRLKSAAPANARVYNLLLRGRHLVERLTLPDCDQAIALYQQALAIDRADSRVWAALAWAHYRRSNFAATTEIQADIAGARQAAVKAVALDPGSSQGHSMLGLIKGTFDWDWLGADAEFKRALALDPGSVVNLRNMAGLESQLGRSDEALALIRRVIELDPATDFHQYELGLFLYRARRFAEAETVLRQALQMNPQTMLMHRLLGGIYVSNGKPDLALAEMEKETDGFWRLEGRALAFFAAGRIKEADAALAELIRRYEKDGPSQIAEVFAFRNEADQAFAWLEKAYALRDPGLSEIYQNPLLDRLKSDPRFVSFLKKMNFPV